MKEREERGSEEGESGCRERRGSLLEGRLDSSRVVSSDLSGDEVSWRRKRGKREEGGEEGVEEGKARRAAQSDEQCSMEDGSCRTNRERQLLSFSSSKQENDDGENEFQRCYST